MYVSSVGTDTPRIARPIAVPVHVSNGAAADIRGRICVEAALFAYQEGNIGVPLPQLVGAYTYKW